MEQPLVSIVVITYNSAKTVIETLDSARNQTYQNIELIISDDCSTDDTVEICRNWIAENKDRFVRTELITVEKNTGIPGNLNRAYEKTNGEWIKGLAGDDIFLSNCIEDNVSFVSENPKVNILFSLARCFSVKNGECIEKGVIPASEYIPIFNKSAKEQLIQLYRGCFVPAPTLFINRKFALNNPYDENYKYMEDYPMWVKLTKDGNKLYFMNKMTIAYRLGNSVSKNQKALYNILFMETLYAFRDSIREQTLKYHPKIVKQQDFERKLFFIYTTFFKNKKNFFSLSTRSLLIKLFEFWLKFQ